MICFLLQLEKVLAYYLSDLRFGEQVVDPLEKRILDEFGAKIEEWCSSTIFGIITGEIVAKAEALEAVMEATNVREAWRHQRIAQINK